jgi:hypothetical protein
MSTNGIITGQGKTMLLGEKPDIVILYATNCIRPTLKPNLGPCNHTILATSNTPKQKFNVFQNHNVT